MIDDNWDNSDEARAHRLRSHREYGPDIASDNHYVCPWCGYVEHDSWEHYGEHGEIETDCGNCEKPIVLNQDVTVHWVSSKGHVPQAADLSLDGPEWMPMEDGRE